VTERKSEKYNEKIEEELISIVFKCEEKLDLPGQLDLRQLGQTGITF
jgi:hypothetical protein